MACRLGRCLLTPGFCTTLAAVCVVPAILFAAPPLPEPRPPGVSTASAAPAASFAARRQLFLEGALVQTHRLERATSDIGAQTQAEAAIAAAVLAAHGAATGASANRYLAEALESCHQAHPKVGCQRASLLLARLLLEHRQLLDPKLFDQAYSMLTHLPPPPGSATLAGAWNFAETENQRLVTIANAIAAAALLSDDRSGAAVGWQRYCARFLRARLQSGWYEQDSPGYLAISINALLLIADHAPNPQLRRLASRQLDILFATWAQNQVGGYPAGPKSRTYLTWALSDRSTPWAAWYWLITGRGEAAKLSFINSVDLAVARYRVPERIAQFAASRDQRSAYQVLARRQIEMARRRNLDAALYSWVTPGYILSAAQAVDGLRLAVSGGQEIAVALYPAGVGFSPLYLWSRASKRRAVRWKSYAKQDLAVGDHNLALGRFGSGQDPGYAYLAPGWTQPRIAGNVATAQIGSAQVALVTEGGWTLARAGDRFPSLYRSASLSGAWVLVPRRQPAIIALEVGEVENLSPGEFRRAARRDRAELKGGVLTFRASYGQTISFQPGVWAHVNGGSQRKILGRSYPLLSGPLLSRSAGQSWRFSP